MDAFLELWKNSKSKKERNTANIIPTIKIAFKKSLTMNYLVRYIETFNGLKVFVRMFSECPHFGKCPFWTHDHNRYYFNCTAVA